MGSACIKCAGAAVARCRPRRRKLEYTRTLRGNSAQSAAVTAVSASVPAPAARSVHASSSLSVDAVERRVARVRLRGVPRVAPRCCLISRERSSVGRGAQW